MRAMRYQEGWRLIKHQLDYCFSSDSTRRKINFKLGTLSKKLLNKDESCYKTEDRPKARIIKHWRYSQSMEKYSRIAKRIDFYFIMADRNFKTIVRHRKHNLVNWPRNKLFIGSDGSEIFMSIF